MSSNDTFLIADDDDGSGRGDLAASDPTPRGDARDNRLADIGEEAVSERQPMRPSQRSGISKSVREWVLVVIIAISAAVLMKLFVVQQFYVSGESMDYTLHNFDRVLVNKLSYDLHDPNRGDVVVLEESQGLSQRDLIKRVIGLPGETIEMRDCVVYIDNRVLVEPYLDPKVVTPGNCGPNFAPVQVQPDHVFVMGDNRPGSGDSRGNLGQVDYSQIVGRAFVVIWPRSHWQWL